MKTEIQIKEHIKELYSLLNDALENPNSDWDANDLQVAIQELNWVLN